MASKIKHSFKDGALALIKGGWANRVARVCSYWIGRNGIDVLIPENPSGNSPCSVSLNVRNATKLIVNEIQTGLGLILDRAHLLELRVVKKTNASTGAVLLDYVMLYLPTNTLYFDGTAYTVSGTTALGNGWVKVGTSSFRTTGNYWLVQGTGNTLTFSTNALSDTTKISYFIGSVGASDPWTVTQYPRAVSGNAVVRDGSGSGGDPLPTDNITGTVMNGRLVKGTGSYTVTSSVYAPDANHQLVTAPENMGGNNNCLPMLTLIASQNNAAKIGNSGISVVDMTTKKAIKGENVKIDANGATIHEWDNVAVNSDGTLKLDQTDYAWFDTDAENIKDQGVVVADGTEGKVKTLEKLDMSKVKIDESTTLEDLINSETSKIADTALDLFEEEGGEFYIDFDNTDAYVGDGNALVGTNSEGKIQEACDIPQTPSTNKVLMVKSGATTPSFEDFTAGDSVPQTLQVKAVTTTSHGTTTLSYLKVYLPQTTMKIWDGTHSFRTGTSTGYIQAVSGETGWYRIYGITTGNLYLVDDSYLNGTTYTRMVKFATAALSDTQRYSGLVATIAFASGKATITQGGTPLLKDACPSNGASQERPKKANENLYVWHSAGGSSTIPSGSRYTRDTQVWERGVTQTLNSSGTMTSTEFCGFRIMLITRVERLVDTDIFYWRYAYFDKNGCLYKMDAESDKCFIEFNENYA